MPDLVVCRLIWPLIARLGMRSKSEGMITQRSVRPGPRALTTGVLITGPSRFRYVIAGNSTVVPSTLIDQATVTGCA